MNNVGLDIWEKIYVNLEKVDFYIFLIIELIIEKVRYYNVFLYLLKDIFKIK